MDELLSQNEELTVGELDSAIHTHLPKIKSFVEYLQELGHRMNPFTQIRHCLYAHNKVMYLNLMREGPMKNFDRWNDHGTVHPSEIH